MGRCGCSCGCGQERDSEGRCPACYYGKHRCQACCGHGIVTYSLGGNDVVQNGCEECRGTGLVLLAAELLESAAKAAYEKMVSFSCDEQEAPKHAWEKQDTLCRECWRRAVEAAFAAAFP